MTTNEATGTIEHLLTDEVRDAIDRSAYGDWRSIATADAVSLSFGFPDPSLFPDGKLVDGVEAVLREESDEALQYGSGTYASRLEEIVTEWERQRGLDMDEHDVLLTNGATHAIDTICRAFLDPGDVVAVEEPTFMGALGVFWNFGVELVSTPVDENGLDPDTLEKTLAKRRERGARMPKLLYTIPDFHNPTGTTLTKSRRERVVELAREYDFAVLEDGAYSDLRYDGDEEPSLATLDPERVVRVGTFSKTIAPGLRLGWLSAPQRVRDAARTLAAGGTNTFTRSLVGWYCDEGHLDAALPDLRATYADKRDTMLSSLSEHMPEDATWTAPDGGFFVWVELPGQIDTDDMLSDAIDAGTTYLPGSMFYPGEGGTNCLRLSYSHVTEEEIEAGIEALGEAVDDAY